MKNKEGFFLNNFFPKNRKASHVGIVISFVIFIIFLTFLYSLIESSAKTQKDKQTILDSLEKKLIENLSVEVTSVTILVDVSLPLGQDCIRLKNFVGKTGINSPNISVKDSAGDTQGSYAIGDDLEINRDDTSNLFFKIYSSKEFGSRQSSFGGCGDAIEGGYTLGLTKTKKYIFKNKVLELISEDSETLREELNLPLDVGFFFSFEENDGAITPLEKNIPKNINVYVEKVSIHYMDTEANLLPGFITIKVW